ncbi:MAG TPA: GNAT family N-acetyltransferase [Noviherbaspirillum sp.]|jgi:GNAT superfamily N-acetyltransferase|uniref:GNAT family N-acetyltransferase n=1 Tax=Noviherbaspirillum sp. TaxID=1926288 RepID=UPI002DDD0AAA|nr:GNAT family N-acetyltransferase [Noviherbaspirillum sp.]HEV2611636.1 GNAT family N-acetyltransferase [Noviherbaspirillum sp.]
MSIRIRAAEIADTARIATLFNDYRQFYGQASDPALATIFIAERLAGGESVILLAEDDNGDALGFTQLYPSFSSVSACRIWILNDLFVAPSARGRGIGNALLDAAKFHASTSGAKRLDLSTARSNPARRLYEAKGYMRDDEFIHYTLMID